MKYRYRISIKIFRPFKYQYRISIGIIGPVWYQYCIGIEISVLDGISIVSVSNNVVSKGSDWYPGMASWGQRPQIMAILLQGCGDLKGLANHLEPKADEAIIPTSNHAKKKEENMPIALETATHV